MMKRTNLCVGMLLVCLSAGKGAAECPPEERTVLIEPGHVSFSIDKQALVGGSTAEAVLGSGLPLHGTLSTTADDLVFTPNDDFWTVGNDSFTVTIGSPVPGSSPPQVKTVRLVAMVEPDHSESQLQDFEGPLGFPWEASCLGSTCTIGPAGALTASQGLRIIPSTGAPSVAERQDGGHGGSDTAGAGNNYRPPPIGGGSANCEADCPPADQLAFRVLALGADPEPSYAVETRRNGLQYEMQIVERKGGFDRRSSWVAVPGTAQNVRLLTWNDDETNRIGGAFLMVDRELKSAISTVAGTPPLLSLPLRIGLLDPVTASGTFDFDDIETFSTTIAGQDCRQADDFEAGAVDGGWTETYGNAALVVDPEAKAAGAMGLLVSMVDTGGVLGGQLGASLGNARHRYGARFRIDPSNLTIPTNSGVLLAEWRTASGTKAFRVSLVQNGSDLRLRVYARQDDGTVVNPNAFTLSRAPHTIEVDWLRSPTDAADAGTGYARVWVDGVRRFTVPALANDGLQVEEVRIGATSANATGRVFLDQIELWDSP